MDAVAFDDTKFGSLLKPFDVQGCFPNKLKKQRQPKDVECGELRREKIDQRIKEAQGLVQNIFIS